MKTRWNYLILLGFAVLLMASRNSQNTFDEITLREFELVDENGKQSASIKVEPDGEIILRLRDGKGAIRVKLGASEDGSELVMLDKDTNPAVHVLAKQDGEKFTVTDKEGKKREY